MRFRPRRRGSVTTGKVPLLFHVGLAVLTVPSSVASQTGPTGTPGLGDVLRVVSTGDGRPQGVAFDGTHFFVSDDSQNDIVVLGPDGSFVRQLNVTCPGGSGFWQELAFDPNGGVPALWGRTIFSGVITYRKIDVATGALLASVHSLPGANPPNSGAFDPSDGSLFYFAPGLQPDRIANVAAAGAANCTGSSAVPNPARGFPFEDVEGLEVDGPALWINAGAIVKRTSTVSPEVELQFTPPHPPEFETSFNGKDLALDTVTFAPYSALWMIWSDFPGVQLLAYRVPREVVEAAIDIAPGSCPNELGAAGFTLKVALLGSSEFDPALVDAASVRLRRHGDPEIFASVAALGPGTFADVSSRETGCDAQPDGLVDLVLDFDRDALETLFHRYELVAGSEVELQLDGFLADGTGFDARDRVLPFGWKLSASGLVPGDTFALEVEDATPFARILFAASLEGPGPGVHDVPGCGPIAFDLSAPRVLKIVDADAEGRARLAGTLPRKHGTRPVWFQALDLEACHLTRGLVRFPETAARIALVLETRVGLPGLVRVVDLEQGTVVATLPGGTLPHGAVIAPDGRRGYFTATDERVFEIALDSVPPRLVRPPIPVTTDALDIAQTPDGRFLLVSGASNERRPVVVIDTATRTQISQLRVFHSDATFDLGAEGSVVISANGPLVAGSLYGARLGADGTLESTDSASPEEILLEVHVDVDVAPDGRTVVALGDCCSQRLTSHAIADLSELETVVPSLSPGISGCFDASGTRYFMRSDNALLVFAYDPRSGDLGQILRLTVPAGDTSRRGVEQMALDDVEDLLWLTTGTELRAYDPTSGALVRTIPGVPGRALAIGPPPSPKTVPPASPRPPIVR